MSHFRSQSFLLLIREEVINEKQNYSNIYDNVHDIRALGRMQQNSK